MPQTPSRHYRPWPQNTPHTGTQRLPLMTALQPCQQRFDRAGGRATHSYLCHRLLALPNPIPIPPILTVFQIFLTSPSGKFLPSAFT
ncbi:hypothetical protein LOD75_06650, partial [Xylella fastidiosa subsp. multiplex]